MPDEYVVVLSTLPAEGDVARLAKTLVEERLAACVNILAPMSSIYRWKGGIEEDSERQIVIKTTRTRVPGLWDRLRALHPYEVPEFVVLPIISGSDDYLKWIGESVGDRPT